MTVAAVEDPILKRFRAALDQLYGDRIERVVLFGSRDRDDARAEDGALGRRHLQCADGSSPPAPGPSRDALAAAHRSTKRK